MPNWLALSLAVSVSAQLWCFPVLLGLQGGFPTFSVVANLLAEPVVGPITILGLVACLLSAPFPLLASVLSWVASWPASWVIFVAQKFSNLPEQLISWPVGWVGMGLSVAVVAAVTMLTLQKLKILASISVATVLAFLLSNAAHSAVVNAGWPQPDWQIVNCNVGQGDALVIRSVGKVAVVDVGKQPQPIDTCLTHLGVSHIDLLVLTHFDLDHVGGLSGALHNRSVSEGMLTSFSDPRPQAATFEDSLRAASEVTVHAAAGMQGSLGKVHWTVMEPEPGGADSEDSNDGSIAMRWDAADYTLYTMADLPEKGQMRLAENHLGWLAPRPNVPVILKVSHHGSADQYPELIEYQHPAVALISVGAGNPYGHPTQRTLNWLAADGASVFRTDLMGGLSVAFDAQHRPTVLSGG